MSVNTPLGDTLDRHIEALFAGRSAITHWTSFDSSRIASRIGGELGHYDIQARLKELATVLAPPTFAKLRRLAAKTPWSVKLSLLLAIDAWRNAGLNADGAAGEDAALVVAGHNINNNYRFRNEGIFREEPDFIDGLYAIHNYDTTHAGCVSELLGIQGSAMVAGAACATGGFALRAAIDEIRAHGAEVVLVLGAVGDISPIEMHAMGLIGAISQDSFNDEPQRASRPFDVRREGFVPAHGGAAIVLEPLDRALARGAPIHAELLSAETSADANHLPQPDPSGQARAMRKALAAAGLAPEQIDYINGHFTSTPRGDPAELEAIRTVFGPHSGNLRLNATKSMLGHTLSSAAVVETVTAVLQMQRGRLHPSINIDDLDPTVDLDVCRNEPVDWPVKFCLKNAFGFGGLNAAVVLASPDADTVRL
jgi:3-oxoacyl-(acyl-carrier-protein) synthase